MRLMQSKLSVCPLKPCSCLLGTPCHALQQLERTPGKRHTKALILDFVTFQTSLCVKKNPLIFPKPKSTQDFCGKGWRDDSVVKGTPCSCRELGFGSHGAPQPSITLVPNDLILKKILYWLIFCFYFTGIGVFPTVMST